MVETLNLQTNIDSMKDILLGMSNWGANTAEYNSTQRRTPFQSSIGLCLVNTSLYMTQSYILNTDCNPTFIPLASSLVSVSASGFNGSIKLTHSNNINIPYNGSGGSFTHGVIVVRAYLNTDSYFVLSSGEFSTPIDTTTMDVTINLSTAELFKINLNLSNP